MNYRFPITVSDGHSSVVLASEGWMMKWLRQNAYPVFRTMHVRGWRKCKTWSEVMAKVAEDRGLTVTENGQEEARP